MNMVMCKLCVNIVDTYSNEFEELGEILMEILDVLLLKPNFRENEDPVVCKNCKENLHKAFEFKAKCIDTEDCLYPYMNFSDKLNLKAVYFKEKTKKQCFQFNEHEDVCRFCLNLTRCCTPLISEILKYDQFFGKFMPELNLEATDKAVVCERCHVSLEKFVKFVKFCLDNQWQLIENIQKGTDQDNESKMNFSGILPHPLGRCTKSFKLELDSVLFKALQDTDDETSSAHMEETAVDKSDRDDFLPIAKLDNYKDSIKSEEIEIKSDEGSKSGTLDGGIDRKENTWQIVSEGIENISVTKEEKSISGVSIFKIHKETSKACTEIHKYPDQQKNFLSFEHMFGHTRAFQVDNKDVHKTHILTDESSSEVCGFHEQNNHSNARILIHNEISEAEMFKCDMCDYRTNNKYDIKSHMIIHNGTSDITMYKCGICNYETKQKRSIKPHMLIHKDISKIQMYKCEICDYQTKYKGNLNCHIIIHKNPSEIKMFQCNVCTYKTRHKKAHKVHLLIHNKPSEIKMFKCEICTFESKQKIGLKYHMLAHKKPSEIQLFQCDICSYKTKWKGILRNHIFVHKKHSEIQMYLCGICSFKAKLKSNLDMHMLVHKKPSDIKMHQCEFCTYKSKYKSSVKTHTLIHKNPSDMIRFKCGICTYEAKLKSSLNIHMLVHTKSSDLKMLKCEMCSYEGKRKMYLKRHMLTHKEKN